MNAVKPLTDKQARALYQREKRKRDRRMGAVIAAAKAAFDAELAVKKNFRTGRPRKVVPISITSDPADALVNATRGRR